jgi:hypothetical protein
MASKEKKMEGDFIIEQKKILFKKFIKRVGHPPEYKTPQDMLDMVNQYLTDGCEIGRKVVGRAPNQRVIEFKRLGYYALLMHLGFTSRRQMVSYGVRHPKFEEVLKYGKTAIASHYESLGQDGVSPTFMNFMLHNIDGLIMSKEDSEGGYEKKVAKISFNNHNKEGKVKTLNGTNNN